MKIQKRSKVDPKIDCFRFRLRSAAPDVVQTVEDIFRQWLTTREAMHLCECSLKHLQVIQGRGNRTVRVLFGWFCDRCLTELERLIDRRLPEATSVSVGCAASPYPPPDQRFLVVQDKAALFEDGCRVTVARFSIRRSMITTAEFQVFADAAGYETTAEIQGHGSFRFDETIEPIRLRDRGNVPVHSVSFKDAIAYCDWANLRLPTEAEWLAAAIIDDRIMDSNQARDFMFGQSGRFDRKKHPDCARIGDGMGCRRCAARTRSRSCGSRLCARDRLGKGSQSLCRTLRSL